MASTRFLTLAALVALLAVLGGASARRLLGDSDYKEDYPHHHEEKDYPHHHEEEDYSPPKHHYSPPKEDYSPPEEDYSPPEEDYKPPTKYYSPPKEDYKPPTKYYSPPEKPYEPAHEYSCEEYAKQCDFKFLYGGIPTFHLIAHGDHAYDPIIVDKDGYVTKVLNPNGKCEILGSYGSYDSSDSYKKHKSYGYGSSDCRNEFYFQSNRVASRTFNIRPVEEFEGKCIRLDITAAQLWNNVNLNPYDNNKEYPEHRRCVVFQTAY